LKIKNDDADLTSAGKAFQNFGASTGNARHAALTLPNTSKFELDEHNVRIGL
jgi:hypothetical protein